MTGPNSAVYNGRYELRSQVARGGTAQVYLARDLLLDRPVALKVLDPQLSTDRAFVERFRREAQAAANLSHPNIVPVFDWGESENTYFIVMEYVDGEPLSSIIRTQAPLDAEQAASIAADIAKALAYAHRHGVVHRDVKPGNVLITSDGQVKVTDFGIARAIGADEQVTQTGLVMGTATYFSPEQAQGLGVDGRSDLYSLGVVLYEMVTGRPPFSGDTPVSIAYQHVREIAPMPRQVNPAIPAAMEAIICQAMAKVPAERYATADELRADLDRFLRHQPVAAKIPGEYGAPATAATTANPVTTTERPARTAPAKRRSTTLYWALAGLALLAGIVVSVILGGRALGYFGGARFYTIPEVRQLSPSAAQSTLRSHGFVPRVVRTVSGNATVANEVVSESPGFPSTARAGAVIDLVVAGNAPSASVPDVVNQLRKDAVAQLKAAGFKVTVKNVSPTNPLTQKNNQVIKEQPGANSVRAQGSTVTISVVQTKLVAVPAVLGETEAQAVVDLTKAGFVIGTPVEQFSASVPTGDVISSAPAAPTQVASGATVTLTISEGPGVTVPNLLGDSESQAVNALLEAGLVPKKGAPIGTQVQGFVGNVASQDVTDGTQVAPGTTVKYRIGIATGPLLTTTTIAGTPTGATGAGSPTGASGQFGQ